MTVLSSRARVGGALLALMLSSGLPPAQAAGYPEARKIVSVGGSLTEIVHALGEQGRLVARDTTSTYPAGVEALPDVGYMRALSAEGLLAVGPDLILAEAGSGPPEVVEQLKAAGVPFVTIPDGWTRNGVTTKIRAVGEAIGVGSKADDLAARVEQQLDEATAFAAAQPGPVPKVLFVLSTQGGRIMASGTGTQADGIIRMAGGQNAVSDFQGYKQLTDEAVISAAPDVILMMDRGGPLGTTEDQLFALPAIAMTPAAADRRLVRMDGLYLIGFGPRIADAVHDLAAALHGGT